MVVVNVASDTVRVSEGSAQLIELVSGGNNEIPVSMGIDVTGTAMSKFSC